MKKEEELVTLKVTKEQAQIISNALDAYSRAKMGQFKNCFNAIFGFLDYDDGDEIEKYLREKIFPNDGTLKNPNASYGMGYDKDSDEAFHMRKDIDEWVSVKNNNGYYGSTVNFQGRVFADKDSIVVDKDFRSIKIPIENKYVIAELERIWEENIKNNSLIVWDMVEKYFPFDTNDVHCSKKYFDKIRGKLYLILYKVRDDTDENIKKQLERIIKASKI